MTVVVMFPGQGVQRLGMGQDLFDEFPDIEAAASDVLGYSLRQLCTHDAHHQLDDTRYTQPAVYMVNALAYRRWLANAEEPDLAIGHSLGELNALEAAGVFDLLDGLRLVVARAQCTAGVPGGMTAVLGLPEDEVRSALASGGCHDVEIANFNGPTQLILAGPVASLIAAESALNTAGAADIRRLAVDGPFHSSHMSAAAAGFATATHAVTMREPSFPVIANRTAKPHQIGELPRMLAEHLDHPVLWHRTLMTILDQDSYCSLIEIGGPGILTRMAARLRPQPLRSPS
ncbi:ACP S-malonyltransferase [Catellatospora coxensis]|uniref:Malonyl CoA-acyl carrier protein transacylase n=1 Tax=Catellatospora coxensis TaxID=310354 RepID=A0A8J3L664_9ACTN|nr:ACP S-malonyltransferase [Catellatospora coxensis]GIG07140.1 malonyl CoA-acyl carrier protein transacylase [Catellatospora coxensis]